MRNSAAPSMVLRNPWVDSAHGVVSASLRHGWILGGSGAIAPGATLGRTVTHAAAGTHTTALTHATALAHTTALTHAASAGHRPAALAHRQAGEIAKAISVLVAHGIRPGLSRRSRRLPASLRDRGQA